MRHVALLGLLAACGSTASTPSTGTTVAPPPAALSASVEVKQRDGATIMADAVVKTGTDFEVQLRLTRDAYVYVAQVSNGEASLLWPLPLQTARLSTGTHRLPAAGYWLYTDGPPGESTLVLVAATEPLGLSAPDLAAAFGEVEAPGGGTSGHGPSTVGDASDPAPSVGGGVAEEGVEPNPDATADAEAPPATPSGSLKPLPGGAGGGADRKDKGAGKGKPKPLLRESQGWEPRADELAAFHPRGRLRSRDIKLRKDNPDVVDADTEGVVVYKLSFRHAP